ncbi:ankyrin repeat domain-containing protein [Pseudomonas sp. X10]
MNDSEKLYEKHEAKLDRLYDAIEDGKLEQVRKMAEKHPELLPLPRYGQAEEEGLLHMAARSGHEAICSLLLDLGLDPNLPVASEGYSTALEYAAGEGHLQTCVCLLDAGAQVDGLPISVCNPLYAAAMFGQLEVVELLLSRGADINRLHRKFNNSPLDAADEWGAPEVAALLTQHGGRSVTDVQSADAQGAGQSIVTFVHNSVGWVLPATFSPANEDPRATLHVSLIDGKTDFKLLFTVGLYQASPMTEMFVCLPGDWALPREGFAQDSVWRFPVQLLARLTRRTIDNTPLAEGSLIERSNPEFADLPWPAEVDAMLVVDKPWNKDTDQAEIPENEKVFLFTLAPVKFTHKGAPDAKALAALVERKRTASWKVLALTSPE